MTFDWRSDPCPEFAATLAARVAGRRPAVVALDGHSSSGKSSLAVRLAASLPDAAVLHTDDLAWHHGVLSWDELLLGDVLPVVRSGRPLTYRPPAWADRGRPGAIELPASLGLLLVEGVGASQDSVRAELDLRVWVETREPTRLARDALRVAAAEIGPEDYAQWMAAENAHMVAEQPWRHADLVVSGDDRGDPALGRVWWRDGPL